MSNRLIKLRKESDLARIALHLDKLQNQGSISVSGCLIRNFFLEEGVNTKKDPCVLNSILVAPQRGISREGLSYFLSTLVPIGLSPDLKNHTSYSAYDTIGYGNVPDSQVKIPYRHLTNVRAFPNSQEADAFYMANPLFLHKASFEELKGIWPDFFHK